MSTTRCRNSHRRAGWALLSLLLAGTCLAQEPQVEAMPASHQHLGPASCASSACHGRVSPERAAKVRLDEYRIWSREDRHARAYQTLLTDESKAMARRLGIGPAHEAKVCLDCHADNVPPEQRGERFQLSDGVGCEACHGGAGDWIASHAVAGATHADNLERGLMPLSSIEQRAQLCLSCHFGTAEKFAGHDLMAAGHPRLTFELVAFTANQPAHFDFDEDYFERKGQQGTLRQWLLGLAQSVQSQAALLRSERFARHGLFPELALFDCHACHHPMDDRRGAQGPLHAGLDLGAVRLNDAHARLLLTALQALRPDQAPALQRAINQLHRASQRGLPAIAAAAAELDQQMRMLPSEIPAAGFATDDLRRLQSRLLDTAASGGYRDFVAAEQAYFALETLAIELGQARAQRAPMDALFATVEDEHRFRPDRFQRAAQRLRASR
jgi:hypothetical protein